MPTFGIVTGVVPTVNVPATPAMVKVVTVTAPSALLVPVSRLPVLATSSGVVSISLASEKLSFTGSTVMISVEVSPTLTPASSDKL